MKQGVHRPFLLYGLSHIAVMSVGVTYNQDLHSFPNSFSSRFRKARSALPRWLISFFCSSVSSALLQPNSGR